MKQTLTIALIMLLGMGSAVAKEHKSKHTTVSAGNISVTYGQPSKKRTRHLWRACALWPGMAHRGR